MRYFTASWVLLGCWSVVVAEERQDALKGLIAKSEYIIAGELAADPTATTGRDGGVGYQLEMKVVAVLKNRPPKEAEAIPKRPDKGASCVLKFTRTEFSDEDKLPFLKKGSKCILFLKYKQAEKVKGFYAPQGLADVWLGIQPYSPSLAKTISDVANQGSSPEKK